MSGSVLRTWRSYLKLNQSWPFFLIDICFKGIVSRVFAFSFMTLKLDWGRTPILSHFFNHSVGIQLLNVNIPFLRAPKAAFPALKHFQKAVY